jgi:NRPS condensation-like uncharacterized protein
MNPSGFPSVLGDRLLHALLPHVSDSLIHAILEFDQPLDEQRLARAVELSFVQDPILDCRMVSGFWGMWWQGTGGEAAGQAFSLQPLCKNESLEGALEGYLIQPAEPDREPLVQVRLLRGEQDLLCIKVQHIIADAGAVKQYAYRLAALYTRLGQDPDYRPPVITAPRGYRPLFKPLRPGRFAGMLRRNWRNLKSLSWPSGNGLLGLQSGDGERFFIQRQLAAAPLKAFARQHQATLNDLALAAALRAFATLADLPSGTPHRIVNTVDLRRYLADPEGVNTCNLSAFSYLNLGEELGEGFVDTLLKVRDEMNFQKGDYIGIGELPAWLLLAPLPFAWLRAIGRRAFAPDRRTTPPGLTNMGPFDGERLKFGTQRPRNAWTTAPVVFSPMLVLGLSGYGDNLTLSLGGSGGAKNRALCEELLGRMLVQLDGAESGSGGQLLFPG